MMSVVSLVFSFLALVVLLFLVALVARLVLDWVQVLVRDWRPRSFALVIAEVVYTVTDPPLSALRRVIKPIRLGAVQLDLSFIVLFLAVSILLNVLNSLAA